MTTPDQSAQQLIDAANTFIDVIEQENEALRAVRVADLAALQDAKLTASEIYESRLQDAIRHGAAPERLSPAMRAALNKCQIFTERRLSDVYYRHTTKVLGRC